MLTQQILYKWWAPRWWVCENKVDGGLILVHSQAAEEPLVLLLDRLTPWSATFRGRTAPPRDRRLRLEVVLAPGSSVEVMGELEGYDERWERGRLLFEEALYSSASVAS